MTDEKLIKYGRKIITWVYNLQERNVGNANYRERCLRKIGAACNAIEEDYDLEYGVLVGRAFDIDADLRAMCAATDDRYELLILKVIRKHITELIAQKGDKPLPLLVDYNSTRKRNDIFETQLEKMEVLESVFDAWAHDLEVIIQVKRKEKKQ